MTVLPISRAHALRAVMLGTLLALAFVLAVPRFHSHSCRGGHNEVAAISTLRRIASAQQQFRAAGHVDQDGDGVGDIGTFLELSGAARLRGFAAPIESPSSEVGAIESQSAAQIEPGEGGGPREPC